MAAIPEPEALTSRSAELLARTDPQVLDLAIAIVAGAAGAYVLVRREAIGALPGVAIAVALVPPLATVGMMLQLGEPGLAGDALLLYVTNLAGIVLSGSLVLLLLGVQPTRVQGRLATRTRIGIGATVVLALLVPLLASTRKAVTDATNVDNAQSAAESWATEQDLELRRVSVEGDTVDVDVAGARPPPTIEPLAREFAEDFNSTVRLTVGWTRQLVLSARADPDGRSTSDPTPPPRPDTGPPPGPGQQQEGWRQVDQPEREQEEKPGCEDEPSQRRGRDRNRERRRHAQGALVCLLGQRRPDGEEAEREQRDDQHPGGVDKDIGREEVRSEQCEDRREQRRVPSQERLEGDHEPAARSPRGSTIPAPLRPGAAGDRGNDGQRNRDHKAILPYGRISA